MQSLMVTGGAGFIGSNFVRYWLQNHPEDRVVNLDALTYAGNLESLKDVEQVYPDRYTFVRGDIGYDGITGVIKLAYAFEQKTRSRRPPRRCKAMAQDQAVLLPLWYAIFLLSVTCHEAAHAFAAYRGGDPTAYLGGQVFRSRGHQSFVALPWALASTSWLSWLASAAAVSISCRDIAGR